MFKTNGNEGCSEVLFMLEKCQLHSLLIFGKLIVLGKRPFQDRCFNSFKKCKIKTCIISYLILKHYKDLIHDTAVQADIEDQILGLYLF